MKYLNSIKIYLKSLFISFLVILVSTLVMTILSYFNILPTKSLSFIKIITLIISLLIGGYFVGHNCKSKGWLEGIKYSLVFIIIILLINLLILKNNFEIKNIIYYIIMIISSMIGSMYGITRKGKD